MPQPKGRKRPTTIKVETERVEGRVAASAVVQGLRDTALAEARAARRDPKVTKEVEDRFHKVHQLAGELASELERLEATAKPRAPRGTRKRKK